MWARRALHSACEPLFWDRPSYQAEKGASAGRQRAGEGQKEEALGFPGHPPLCQSECVWERPKVLPRTTEEGANPVLLPCVPRWRMGAACLTRTSVRKWTRSCLRAMTPQPAASPGSSMLWLRTLSISRGAERRSRASWGMAPPSPGECSRDRRALPTQLDKNPWPVWTLPALMLGFVSGTTWIRCPTPPCASRRLCDSTRQSQ